MNLPKKKKKKESINPTECGLLMPDPSMYKGYIGRRLLAKRVVIGEIRQDVR